MTNRNFEGETIRTDSKKIQLGSEVGSGAEGTVYYIQGNDSEVVKIFNPDKRSEKAEKVRAMIENEPNGADLDQQGTRSIIWPTAIAEDSTSNEFLGYRMPYIDADQAKNAQRYAREDLRWDQSDKKQRLKTAYNLASTVRSIHDQGHAMGDYNHQNILIKNGYITLIDCDAFHITGANRTYPDDTFFPRYAPPEGRGNNLNSVRKADLFQLGVHIFQLLMEGFHPFQAQGSKAVGGGYDDMIQENPFSYEDPEPGKIEPHSQAPDYHQLPTEVRELFSDCFDKDIGRDRNWGRPEAKKWVDTLKQVSGISTDEGETNTPDPSESETGSDLPEWMNEDSDTDGSTQPTNNNNQQDENGERDFPDWMDEDDGTDGSTQPTNNNNQQDENGERDFPDWMDEN